ncbi:condensation domain-containing protein [Marilutibacter chinensis]|nr:condensation domain-containing protein [Lysobacter chinensis]
MTLFERGMYLGGRTPVAIVFPARIRGRLREERLRDALARVQARHPLLRCRVVPGDGGGRDDRPWFQLQERPAPVPLRIVERTGDEHWRHESRNEWKQPFDADLPLIRVTWLRGAETSELLLVCHHCICDGRSIIVLLRDILLLCGRPDQDIGTRTSLQPLEEILPEAVRRNARLRWRTRWKAALFALFIRCRRPRPALTYGGVYAIGWSLDRAATQSLAKRCKAERVTMFSALCAAFVAGFDAIADGRGGRRFAVPVDVRRFLPALDADGLFAMAPTIVLSPRAPRAGLPSDTEFWALARTLKADMDDRIDRLGPRVHENLVGMERLHAVFDRLIAYGQSRPSGDDVTLSWLGRLDLKQDHGDFHLEAVHSPTAMLAPTPANLVTMCGFDGALDFALTSDDRSLPVEQARTVRDGAMAALHAALSRPQPGTRTAEHPAPVVRETGHRNHGFSARGARSDPRAPDGLPPRQPPAVADALPHARREHADRAGPAPMESADPLPEANP